MREGVREKEEEGWREGGGSEEESEKGRFALYVCVACSKV